MAKGEGLKKAFTDLYNEFGRPLVNRIMDELGADATPQQVRRAAKQATPSLSAKPQKSLAVQKALPAPPKPLALPAPGPGLPAFAVKPRGGQWWVDKGIGAMRQSDLGIKIAKLPDTDTWVVRGDGGGMKLFGSEDEARAYVNRAVSEANPNRSPENAARRIADDVLRLSPDAEGPLSQLQAWFNKAAPKYIKNELGTPDDPMRTLAERGALHVGLGPDEWSDAAKRVLRQETIGDVLGISQLHIPEGALPTAGYDYGANVAINMPWLKKAPVTDKIYGIADTPALRATMGMGHLLDEMKNALDPRSGLPPELMLRPESLERMSLPAAAERVSLINKYRAKEMERAALSALDSPAIQTFKEYPENNPMGLRWVELKAPDPSGGLPEGWSVSPENDGFLNPKGEFFYTYPGQGEYDSALQQALKYEGDTMGHCVGGYCDDVWSGRKRIFSLRDAKGEPHVTIETAPHRNMADWEVPHDVMVDISGRAIDAAEQEAAARGGNLADWERDAIERLFVKKARAEYLESLPKYSEDIIQIKGKHNRSPKDDYLPFVQDFVKSQQWGNVGDLGNTGLVRLPDGRYITKQQAEEGIRAMPGIGLYSYEALQDLSPEEWAANKVAFEGFAIGGRVDPDRCFCHNPLSVKKGR